VSARRSHCECCCPNFGRWGGRLGAPPQSTQRWGKDPGRPKALASLAQRRIGGGWTNWNSGFE
jgi:hypothetical protein